MAGTEWERRRFSSTLLPKFVPSLATILAVNDNEKFSSLFHQVFPGIPKNQQILHIEQEIAGSQISALDTVLKTDFERDSLLNEEKMLLQDDSSKDSGRLAQIYQRLQEIDAYSAESRASAILNGVSPLMISPSLLVAHACLCLSPFL